MYCPSCGAALTQGLSYCNRCGGELKPSESLIAPNKPGGLGFVIAFGMALTTGIAIGGMAVVLLFIGEMFRRGIPKDSVELFAILSFLMLFGSVALLGRQMSRLIGVYLQPGNTAPQKQIKAVASPSLPAAQLDAARQPAASVIEHTTRTLNPLYKEPLYKEPDR